MDAWSGSLSKRVVQGRRKTEDAWLVGSYGGKALITEFTSGFFPHIFTILDQRISMLEPPIHCSHEARVFTERIRKCPRCNHYNDNPHLQYTCPIGKVGIVDNVGHVLGVRDAWALDTCHLTCLDRKFETVKMREPSSISGAILS
jgi:hypothetical protein